MHCSNNPPAKVRYKFTDSPQKIFETKNIPIEIRTYPQSYAAVVNEAPNYNPEGFRLSFYSTNNYVTLVQTVYAYKFFTGNFGFPAIAVWHCGHSGFRRQPDGNLEGVNYDPNTIVINPNIKCPQPRKLNRCSLEIRHNNIIIFADQGECPCNYSVNCGEECPEGHCKCPTIKYPGYCCLPCSDVNSKLNTLTSKLNSYG